MMLSPKEAWETVEALTEVLENDETEIKLFLEALELEQKIREIIQKQQALMKRDINSKTQWSFETFTYFNKLFY